MTSSLIRQDVLPVAVGYLLVMGTLAAGLRLSRGEGYAAPAERAGPGESEPAAARTGGRPVPAAGRKGVPVPPVPPGLPGPPAGGWLRLARNYAGTAIGGYLLLMAVVVGYYYGVARVGGAFIKSAFTGSALLIALSTPVYALASWLTERRRRAGRGGGTGGFRARGRRPGTR